jgi:hypothetical protein
MLYMSARFNGEPITVNWHVGGKSLLTTVENELHQKVLPTYRHGDLIASLTSTAIQADGDELLLIERSFKKPATIHRIGGKVVWRSRQVHHSQLEIV